MSVFTKIENGKRVLDIDKIDDFSVDKCIFDVLKEYNFKWIKDLDFNHPEISVWQLTDDIKVLVAHYPKVISSITLGINGVPFKYTRDKRIWFLNESKEIGKDSDMIENMMDNIRNNWGV